MSKMRVYLKNITANWIGYGANLVVMFFLSPFVVHSLGDTQYGIWSLLMSLTGYLGLVELGTRAGMGRYVNYYLGKKDVAKVNGIISTSLAIFVVLGLLLLLVGSVLMLFLQDIFPNIPQSLLPSAKLVVMLVALNLWIAFLSAAFKVVLTSHERFDLSNVINLLVLVVRTVGTIIVLKSERGILELAVVQVLSSLLGMLGSFLLSRRVFAALMIRPALVSRARFREIFGFSIWAFVSNIAMRLLYTTDIFVIMILLGPKQVTFYSIGSILLFRSRELVLQVTGVFAPQIIKDCATEDWKGLRILIRRASDLTMGVTIPIIVGLIFFGHEFLSLWMGGHRADRGYAVLCILAVSQYFALATNCTSAIYSGLNRVKLGSIFTLSQGVINLGLTLIFVMVFGMGIEGVAWGTFYPRIIFGVLTGYLAIRWIGMDMRVLARKHISKWCILTALFLATCWVIRYYLPGGNWPYFFAKIVIVMGIYCPLAWIIMPSREDRSRILKSITPTSG